jgi:hypothetical protein
MKHQNNQGKLHRSIDFRHEIHQFHQHLPRKGEGSSPFQSIHSLGNQASILIEMKRIRFFSKVLNNILTHYFLYVISTFFSTNKTHHVKN